MSDLVRRLSEGKHRLIYSRSNSAADLKQAIDRGYVFLKFTETRGGTELGVPLDTHACDWKQADFEAGRGSIHVEGVLKLDYVPVRLIADIELSTLQGEGRLDVPSS